MSLNRRSAASTEAEDAFSQAISNSAAGCGDPNSVFSNIFAHDNSRQHIGHVYNSVNVSAQYDEEAEKARRLLGSLYFSDIDRRRDAVTYAAKSTFQWLLDPDPYLNSEAVAEARLANDASRKPANFESHRIEWRKTRENKRRHLRTEASEKIRSWMRSGDGLFWIAGRPASGKTTLMKFLRNSERTHKLLLEWAFPSQLVIAEHYFWHSGSELQKSYEGLFRTLLYQVFQADPHLMRAACPRRWNSESRIASPWSELEIYETMTNLNESGTKFCFFIDGLDEYQPQCDHNILAETTLKLVQLTNIKICVSSRPWQIFVEQFCDTSKTLTLEDLNWIDIERHAVQKFQSCARHGTSAIRDKFEEPIDIDAIEFIEVLVERSQGVFLWTNLVMERLVARLQFAQSINDLQDQLWRFPKELETFFRELVHERINPTWRDSSETAAALLLRLSGCRELRYYGPIMSGRALEKADFGFAEQVQFNLDAWFEVQSEKTRSFLHACCTDLLRCPHWKEDSYKVWRHTGVEFSHRTVDDFLRTEDMQQLLKEHTPEWFHDGLGLLERVKLSTVKVLPASHDPETVYLQAISDALHIGTGGYSSKVDIRIAQEVERVMLTILQTYGERLELPCEGQGEEWVHIRLGWWLSAHHQHRLGMYLAENGLLTENFAIATLEGALGVDTDSSCYTEASKNDMPLEEISIRNVDTALHLGPTLNDYGMYRCDWFGDIFIEQSNERSLWHEFLFKWWQLDHDRLWGRYVGETGQWRNQVPDIEFNENRFEKINVDGSKLGKSSEDLPKCYFLRPKERTLRHLASFSKTASTSIWNIAKALIQRGACLQGRVCFTENRKRNTNDDLYEDIVFGYPHPDAACWKHDIGDVLAALIPESCVAELEDMWKMQNECDVTTCEPMDID